jgi:N-acylneuraminate cytidylyltransferase
MSVNRIQQFIWSDKEKCVINTDRTVNPWPNTQDLDPLYEINHAFYINSRHNYLTHGDRIGRAPALYVCEGLRKIDIDWQDDFEIARSLMTSS